MNIPTLFASFLFVVSATLIGIISSEIPKNDKGLEGKWKTFKWIFIFLALDEALQIHEVFIINGLKQYLPPILNSVWVVPYGIFLIWFLIYFKQLIISLPYRVRFLTLMSGSVYVFGALILEIIGNYLVLASHIRLHGISYGMITRVSRIKWFNYIYLCFNVVCFRAPKAKDKTESKDKIIIRMQKQVLLGLCQWLDLLHKKHSLQGISQAKELC